MAEPAAPAGPRRAAFAFIFASVVLDVLALGVIIPVLPKLVEQFMGGDTEQATRMYGHFGTVWALMQFVFSPFLGILSDRFGRRPVILLSCLGLGVDYLFMAVAPSLAWLFVGRILSGITASGWGAASAYVADITPPERRASTYGMMGAAWGLGFVLGPALGGLLGGFSPRLPFWVAGGLCLLNTLYGLLVLPESLPPERRTGFSWARANPIGALVLFRSHRELLGLASVQFLYHLAHQVLPSVFVLYAGYRYTWGPPRVGAMLALVGVCNIVVQAGLVKPVVRRLGERRALLVGLIFGAAGFAMYGHAPSEGMFWAAVPVFALIGLFGPSVQGLMTRRVGPTEQGRLQGANGSIMGLTGLIGPGLFTMTFAEFIAPGRAWTLPGAPFFLAGLMMVLAIPIAWATSISAQNSRADSLPTV